MNLSGIYPKGLHLKPGSRSAPRESNAIHRHYPEGVASSVSIRVTNPFRVGCERFGTPWVRYATRLASNLFG